MPRSSRYRKAEIKAGIWIFFSLLIFAAFMVSITGSKFWKKMDQYRVYLTYVGGLEVGSPVRMGGLLVGKISQIDIASREKSGLMLTIEVGKGLPIKENTLAYLSFISITSEQHLELEVSPESAPLLSPGDLITSKDQVTMDDIMNRMQTIGDSLEIILGSVNRLIGPANIARVDSILEQVNSILQETSPDIKATLAGTHELTGALDTLISNINNLVLDSDHQVDQLMTQMHSTLRQAGGAVASIDTTVKTVDQLLVINAENLTQVLDNLRQVTQNLKELSITIKENPFLLLRAIPKKERKLD